MPATPASPPPPGSGSFTLTPRQAQSDTLGEPKRDQEEGTGPSDGTRSGVNSLPTSIYFFVSRTCEPLPVRALHMDTNSARNLQICRFLR